MPPPSDPEPPKVTTNYAIANLPIGCAIVLVRGEGGWNGRISDGAKTVESSSRSLSRLVKTLARALVRGART